MDVTLHIGAHRCATTTFQHYMRKNSGRCVQQGIGFWGPYRTRKGLFHGVIPNTLSATARNPQKRSAGRIRLNLSQCAGRGVQHLVVSDENMLGTMRQNLDLAQLYPDASDRLARFGRAFGGHVRNVVLNIRSLENYWASVIAYNLMQGRDVPSDVARDWIAECSRSWRDVITDVARAIPDARLWVLPFEVFAGRPEVQLAAVAGAIVPPDRHLEWRNASLTLPELRAALPPDVAARLPDGEGRLMPFSPGQAAALHERYADDLLWLTAGADGLASLMKDQNKKPAGTPPATPDLTRGRRNDQDRRLAGAG